MSPDSPSHICPHCGNAFLITPRQAAAYEGRSFPCAHCGKTFTIAATPPDGIPPGLPAQWPTDPATIGAQPPTIPYNESGSFAGAYAPPFSPPGYTIQPRGTGGGMAVTGFVLSFFGCLPPVALLGVIFSILSLRKRDNPQKGLAIAGLILGLLSTLGGSIVDYGMYQGFQASRAAMNHFAKITAINACEANLQLVGQALAAYAANHNGAYPDGLADLLVEPNATLQPVELICPATNGTPAPGVTAAQQAAAVRVGGHSSYVYLGKGLTTTPSPPPGTILVYDPMINHGNSGMAVLFADGHTAVLPASVGRMVTTELNLGHNPPNVPGIGKY